ncbi:MAG TPA: DUF4136 domain-containing protein [Cellvibrio sp.]|nr:DUF4136 domain-containing protein [Cellvibrio sp.]
MRARHLWQTLVAVFVLSACSTTPDVQTNYDKGADFSAYKTFGFVEGLATDKSGYSTLLTGYFKTAVQREMVGLGYTYSEKNPDLLVNFATNTQERADVRSTGMPSAYGSYGYYGYRRGMYGGYPAYSMDVDTVHYKVGTVNIDVVDAKKKQLVWEGAMEGRLTKKVMEDVQAAVNAAVAHIYTKYPTRAVAK